MTTQDYVNYKASGNIVSIGYIDGNLFSVTFNQFDSYGNSTQLTNNLALSDIQADVANLTAALAADNTAIADFQAVPVDPPNPT